MADETLPTNINQLDPSSIQTEDEHIETQYGSAPQTALAGIEGAAKGIAGPLAPLFETETGLTTPEAIQAREQTNPVAHGLGEAAGFAGSALIPGLGESSLAGQIGNIGEHVAAALPEATTALAKIAQTGIKTGAEMAALQTSDELSKMITQDPNQSIGSAVINVGLSGLLGGTGGSIIGSVSPLWNKAVNKIGAEKLATDFMGESKFLNDNPDLVQGAAQEINDRIESADRLMRGGLKKDLINTLTKDVTPEQASQHVESIVKLIEDAPASLKKEPAFQEALENWQNQVFEEPEPVTVDPNAPGFNPYENPAPEQKLASPGQVFQATENLKRQLQEWGKYNKALVPVGERPFRDASQRLASNLKESLEDSKVWGSAGDAQKEYNKAISPLHDIQKEFLGKFASKEMGDRVADPTKINTYLNQADKSKAGLKSNHVRNFLDQTQKAADAINKAYLENGLEQPFEDKLNPTPILDHSLNTEPSAGVQLARWAKRGGAASMGSNVAGHLAGETVGAGLGFLVGHPLAGAWMGDKILKPVFSALAKPIAEKAINTGAAKASVDYIGNVIKGQRLLSNAASNFFKAGAEIIPKELIPNAASREKTEKSIDYASSGTNALNVAGSLGHYMPDHASSAGMTAANAINYLKSLKPTKTQLSPLDKPSPVDPLKQQMYDRALDIAQQPLMVLKHARNGTLIPQDVQTLNTLYPGLKNAMVQKLYGEMIKTKSEEKHIPYKQKLSLSLLYGQPLDSTMTQSNMASIMSANAPKTQQQSAQPKRKSVSKSTASTMEKMNKMYATPEQSRAAERQTGSS